MNLNPIHWLSIPLLAGLWGAMAAQSAETTSDVWTHLQAEVVEQGEQLQERLKAQAQYDSREQTLQDQLEQSRRLRAMYREAVLISELNVAWIHDQLEHWDCRLAERKGQDIENRLSELNDYGLRLDRLCGDLGANSDRQRQACARQREELARNVDQLQALGRRYVTSCAASMPQPATPTIEGEQPWR
jgi:hypothetical protein